MTPVLVSVLMTAYNREKYIAQAIESVLASTFTNFELIITDDGSKDSTVKIAKHYAAIDTRVRVYENEKNLGDYPNRNYAASLAEGKYIKYVDADDLIYPWGLGLLTDMMENYPAAGWGLCSLAQDSDKIFPFLLSPAEAYRYHYFGNGLFHKAPLSSIIRTAVFKEIGGFSGKRMVGDFEMWHKLSQKYPVLLMPQGMVWYRKHNEQEMNSYALFKDEYDNIKLGFLKSADCPLTNDESKKIIERFKSSSKRKLYREIFAFKFKNAIASYKRINKY